MTTEEKDDNRVASQAIDRARLRDTRKRLFKPVIKYSINDRQAVVETKDGRRRFVELPISPRDVDALNYGQDRTFIKQKLEIAKQANVFYEATPYRVYILPAGISKEPSEKES